MTNNILPILGRESGSVKRFEAFFDKVLVKPTNVFAAGPIIVRRGYLETDVDWVSNHLFVSTVVNGLGRVISVWPISTKLLEHRYLLFLRYQLHRQFIETKRRIMLNGFCILLYWDTILAYTFFCYRTIVLIMLVWLCFYQGVRNYFDSSHTGVYVL